MKPKDLLPRQCGQADRHDRQKQTEKDKNRQKQIANRHKQIKSDSNKT